MYYYRAYIRKDSIEVIHGVIKPEHKVSDLTTLDNPIRVGNYYTMCSNRVYSHGELQRLFTNLEIELCSEEIKELTVKLAAYSGYLCKLKKMSFIFSQL